MAQVLIPNASAILLKAHSVRLAGVIVIALLIYICLPDNIRSLIGPRLAEAVALLGTLGIPVVRVIQQGLTQEGVAPDAPANPSQPALPVQQ